MPKLNWITLILFLYGSGTGALVLGVSAQPNNSSAQMVLAQSTDTSDSSQSPQRRYRPPLGGRDGGVCLISPGLLEDENIVWSDRPLFLWQNQTTGITMQGLTVIDQDGRILWEKSLEAADQSALYEGQPLQPGQFYQWRLEWTVQETEHAADYTFQVMERDRRNQINAELQTLTRELEASGISIEDIAQSQANYLINQEKPLWSDALKVLYLAGNSSVETTRTIQLWLNDICGVPAQQDNDI